MICFEARGYATQFFLRQHRSVCVCRTGLTRNVCTPESARYDAEIRRLKRQIEDIERYVVPIGGEPGDPKLNQQKRKRDKERAAASIDKLKAEQSTQLERHRLVMARLVSGKNAWFGDTDKGTDKGQEMNSFLQQCIFPRCVFSPADAVYSARFVQLMTTQSTPNFYTMQYYDKVFRDMPVHIFSCTERQAANLGRFLKESLAQLIHWKTDESIFRDECSKLLGFNSSFTQQNARIC